MGDAIPYLHVHTQRIWHDDVHIDANRAGLLALIRAIHEVVEHPGETRDATAFCGDGEGFRILITMDERGWQEDEPYRRRLPYTDPIARRAYNGPSRMGPYEFSPRPDSEANRA